MGTRFGCDKYRISPDLITVAKGLTSAYLPLSASIVAERVWKALQNGSDRFGAFSHGYTYTAHPLCASAGLANLQILESENLVEHVAHTGPYLLRRLREAFADHPFVGEVRGDGMLAAVEFIRDRECKQRFDASLKVGAAVSAACLEAGVIARAMPQGDILGFAPPLITQRSDIDEIVERVEGAVRDAFSRISLERG